jgi:hypothetical protein
VDGEARGVVIDSDTHPAFVAAEVVDAIRNRLAMVRIANDEIMDADLVGLTPAPPRPAPILEVADQLLLLRVDRDGRLPALLTASDGRGDVPKLGVPIEVNRPGFFGGLNPREDGADGKTEEVLS